ncbi:MAG: hypothetical protein AVDCRST_MAG22-1133, partial [uncultured Rubrobacteraceae bacterium]
GGPENERAQARRPHAERPGVEHGPERPLAGRGRGPRPPGRPARPGARLQARPPLPHRGRGPGRRPPARRRAGDQLRLAWRPHRGPGHEPRARPGRAQGL